MMQDPRLCIVLNLVNIGLMVFLLEQNEKFYVFQPMELNFLKCDRIQTMQPIELNYATYDAGCFVIHYADFGENRSNGISTGAEGIIHS